MKKLGFGLMRLPLLKADDPSQIDKRQTFSMVDRFLEEGFTYFDTAYMYHNGQSERMVKEALIARHPREQYTVASKMPTMSLQKEEDLERIFSEQLERTGAGYFDYYLMHALDEKHYATAQRLHAFEYVAKQKERGLVKKVGFSFHDSAAVLDRILTEHPEMEFVQLQINYLDWEDARVQSRLCHETAVRHGKQIIIMEPVKGGALAKVPPQVEELLRAMHPDWSVASWAVRYAASLPNVMMVLSGMSDLVQLEDNMGFMRDFVPLGASEVSVLKRAADIIRGEIAIPCTACRYCTEGCPKQIAIPSYFALYNEWVRSGADAKKQAYAEYVAKGFGKASECLACGKCERACPQHLPVIALLRQVAKQFE